MNTITPLISVPSVGTSTSRSGGQEKNLPSKPGQLLKAYVLEAKGPTTFILDIGGNTVSAHAKVPLSVGQTLQLQVVSTTPTTELRIVSDSTNLFLGKSITLLGENIDIRALFLSLKDSPSRPLENLTSFSRQTLESFFQLRPDGFEGKDGGELLKQLVEKIGLSFEALLARGDKESAQRTLKAALMELSVAFKGAEEISQNTNKLLSTIELYQLAQLHLDKENILIFPLPLPFLLKGYLIIEDQQKNHNRRYQNEDHFSLHLALEALGNLRIDFLNNQEGLYIRFSSDSQEKLDFIERFKDELANSMTGAKLLGIAFAKENIDPSADLLKRLIPEGESIVNTKA